MEDFYFKLYHIDSLSGIESCLEYNLEALEYPVVYILYNQTEIYIGETTDLKNRLLSHSKSDKNKKLKNRIVVYSPFFNKSVALGLETFLLKNLVSPIQKSEKTGLESPKRKTSNSNLVTSKHKYFNKTEYESRFPSIWESLQNVDIIEPSLKFDEIQNLDVYKYSPYKELNDDQQDAILKVLRGIVLGKTSFVIRGLAGTGKTIVAIYLMKLLLTDVNTIEKDSLYSEFSIEVYMLLKQINEALHMNFDHHNSAFILPMESLRETIGNVFKSIDGLAKKMVVAPSIAINNRYKLVIVDEAHRLKQYENLSGPADFSAFKKRNIQLGLDPTKGNQLDWIEQSTDIQILFYDKDQSIRKTDVPSSCFKSYFNRRKSIFIDLKQQLRSKGGNLYIDYIDGILKQKLTALQSEEFENFELKLMPSFKSLVDNIKEKETKVGLSRVIAGFAWKWDSKDDDKVMDIEIEGYNYQWNRQLKDWINSKNAINEIGSIHTTQGYDLNYVGIVFGKEIYLDPIDAKIKVDRDFYFDVKGKNKTSDAELKDFIINIYKNMMYRGIYGVYVYCMDKQLQKYLEQYISY
ncbi:DNA/RNA helicase domain-containing protein [Myroides odoratus]|uniref:DNA/RNA helicase domain-containing protein n=1 Tax=Myroides odoratus TaxID=256 RepID=UPI00333FF728